MLQTGHLDAHQDHSYPSLAQVLVGFENVIKPVCKTTADTNNVPM